MFSLFPPRNRRAPAPSFTQIKPGFPARGLFPSAVVHAALFIFFLYPPFFNSLNPPRIIEVRWRDLDPTPHDSFAMTKLYYSAKVALGPAQVAIPPVEKHSNASSAHGKRDLPTPPGRGEETGVVQPIYSGPQEVVSILPNSTNSTQTILRPDLINPPTLKFPQLLKPVVILRSSSPATSDAKPATLVALAASVERIKNTPVELPVAKVASTVPSPNSETQPQPLPEIKSEIPASGPIAAIVLNAVTVPENAPHVVPRAELSGSFAVRAVRSAQSGAGGSTFEGSTPSSDERKTASKAAQGGKGEAVDPPSGISTGNGADEPNVPRKTSAEASAGGSSLNHASQATELAHSGNTGTPSQAAHGLPGITIIGGTGRGSNRVGVIATTPAAYGLTVISAGTSGGASRDLGVFERSETVYTVYIPMADVGGGPDWSIQYAILGPSQAASGLLTPPRAVKKVRAEVTGDLPNAAPSTIFFAAVISSKGELTVKPLRQMDARARQALDALCHWEFLPAQLNGIAVGIKVLIGVATVSH